MLIADNLGAHISQAVMEKCREHNIRLALQYRYRYGTFPVTEQLTLSIFYLSFHNRNMSKFCLLY